MVVEGVGKLYRHPDIYTTPPSSASSLSCFCSCLPAWPSSVQSIGRQASRATAVYCEFWWSTKFWAEITGKLWNKFVAIHGFGTELVLCSNYYCYYWPCSREFDGQCWPGCTAGISSWRDWRKAVCGNWEGRVILGIILYELNIILSQSEERPYKLLWVACIAIQVQWLTNTVWTKEPLIMQSYSCEKIHLDVNWRIFKMIKGIDKKIIQRMSKSLYFYSKNYYYAHTLLYSTVRIRMFFYDSAFVFPFWLIDIYKLLNLFLFSSPSNPHNYLFISMQPHWVFHNIPPQQFLQSYVLIGAQIDLLFMLLLLLLLPLLP